MAKLKLNREELPILLWMVSVGVLAFQQQGNYKGSAVAKDIEKKIKKAIEEQSKEMVLKSEKAKKEAEISQQRMAATDEIVKKVAKEQEQKSDVRKENKPERPEGQTEE